VSDHWLLLYERREREVRLLVDMLSPKEIRLGDVLFKAIFQGVLCASNLIPCISVVTRSCCCFTNGHNYLQISQKYLFLPRGTSFPFLSNLEFSGLGLGLFGIHSAPFGINHLQVSTEIFILPRGYRYYPSCELSGVHGKKSGEQAVSSLLHKPIVLHESGTLYISCNIEP
jgi:hypothetical protein